MLKSVIVLSLLSIAAPVFADCPAKTVAEEGGTHWCFDAGKRGHVHLWKPGRYDASAAVTVVYLHGYDVDGCPGVHYLDCAWSKHGLAAQFAKSGLNALFIAVEGPVNDRQKAKWTSLDPLLTAVRRKGGIRPRGSVTLVAHSGGVFTAEKLLGDDRVAHVVALDAMYADAPKKLAAWYRGSKRRRLTLVGAESTSTWTSSLAGKLGCAESDDLGLPLDAGQASARCAAVIDDTVGHMDLVTDGNAIPMALARTVVPKAQKPRRHKKPRRHR